MSSGVEADVVLDAAVLASLGLVRVLGGAAGLGAVATEALASFAEGRAEARAERVREVRRLEEAVNEVLGRNARIAALADSAHRHKAEIALPPPKEISGSLTELTAWCGQADEQLATAEAALAEAIAADATTRIFETTTQHDIPASVPDDHRQTEVVRVLTRLLPDAADEDLRAVAEAAEHVAEATTAAEAEGHLMEVRLRIQNANRNARRRRDDRTAAARFHRELATHPGAASLRARLAEVDESGDFDEELRAEAVRLLAELKGQAERRYVSDAIRAAFSDLGYDVDEGFETLTARDGEALLTRGDWPQHAVKVLVDDAGLVRMALLRTEPADSDEQRRLDVEREEQWCESFEAARAGLGAAGVHTDVRRRVEPGEQRLPVVRRQAPRQRARERSRERDL